MSDDSTFSRRVWVDCNNLHSCAASAGSLIINPPSKHGISRWIFQAPPSSPINGVKPIAQWGRVHLQMATARSAASTASAAIALHITTTWSMQHSMQATNKCNNQTNKVQIPIKHDNIYIWPKKHIADLHAPKHCTSATYLPLQQCTEQNS